MRFQGNAALSLRRAAICLTAPAISALVWAAPAGASFDIGFGQGGLIPLKGPVPNSRVSLFGRTVQVDSDGRIYALATKSVSCSPRCVTEGFLLRLTPGGDPDPNFGSGWVQSLSPSEEIGFALDPAGGVLVAELEQSRITIESLDDGGARDGRIAGTSAPILPKDTSGLSDVHFDSAGRILVQVKSLAPQGLSALWVYDFRLLRFSPTGAFEPSFGGEGGVAIPRFGTGPWLNAHDGGTILARGDDQPLPSSAPRLVKISTSGGLDPSFARGSRRTVAAIGKRIGQIETITGLESAPGGEIDVFGSAGPNLGFLARTRADGSLVRRFGHGGVRVFRRPFVATAPARGGRVFVRFGDGTCVPACLGGVARLSPAGRIDGVYLRGLKDQEPMQVGTALFSQRGARPLLFEPAPFVCYRGACEEPPTLVRLKQNVSKRRHHSGRRQVPRNRATR
jgi:hypothetical protein